jgi:hypothetical protein
MNDLAEVIEEAIDRFTLTVVLDALEEVCDGNRGQPKGSQPCRRSAKPTSTKRTSHSCRRMSAFGGKADISFDRPILRPQQQISPSPPAS